MKAVTAAQMAKIDALMINHYGISLLQMMENAGLRLAEVVRKTMRGVQRKRVVVCCGPGNNGGGGLVAARHLHNYGATVTVILHGKKLKPVPRKQLSTLKKLNLKILLRGGKSESITHTLKKADIIIDALLGYSIRGNPSGTIKRLIDLINESKRKVISLDVPTGINPDTGARFDPYIVPSATVTLALPKKGLQKRNAGSLYLANISVPDEAYKKLSIAVEKNLFREYDIIRVP